MSYIFVTSCRETVSLVHSCVHHHDPSVVTRAWQRVMPGRSVLRCHARRKSPSTVNAATEKSAFCVCKVLAVAAGTQSMARQQHKLLLPDSGKNSPLTSPFSRKNWRTGGHYAFSSLSALTVLVGWQERCPACTSSAPKPFSHGSLY